MKQLQILSLFLLIGNSAFGAGKPRDQQLAAAFCPFEARAAKALIDHSLLHDTPLASIGDEFRNRDATYGRCLSVKQNGGKFVFTHEEATFEYEVDFDGNGKVLSFEAGRPHIINDSFAKAAASAEKLFPGISIQVSSNNVAEFGHNAQKPLNISSSSQLFLLSALIKEVKARRLYLDQVVRLSPKVKSSALGLLHYWKEDTAVTLDALKNMMIADGDQTAADLLLEALGKPALEREGKTLAPFLSNREFSLLMGKSADIPVKRAEFSAYLARIDDGRMRVPSTDQHTLKVGLVGWFASTEELCQAAYELRGETALFETAMSVHEKEQLGVTWKNVASKDVFANGVRQTTMLLRKNEESPWVCLALTSNKAQNFDEQRFDDLKYRILKIILNR